MSLDNLNTGDILLFSHVSNWSGPFQIFSNFFDFLIKYWTNSKYNHGVLNQLRRKITWALST